MKLYVALALSLCASIPGYAADEPASEKSVRQLLEVTQTKALLDNMMGQVDSMMQNAMKEAAGTTTFTAEQQRVVDDMRKKMVAALAAQMKWEVLEPEFIEIYKKSFTEQEVRGMLDFYRTKAGQAVITKMPLVMQHSLGMMQEHMGVLAPKLQQIQKESLEQMKACCTKGG